MLRVILFTILSMSFVVSDLALAEFSGIGVELSDSGEIYLVFESTVKSGTVIERNDSREVIGIGKKISDPYRPWATYTGVSKIAVSTDYGVSVEENQNINIFVNRDGSGQQQLTDLDVIRRGNRKRIVEKINVTDIIDKTGALRNNAIQFKFQLGRYFDTESYLFYPSLLKQHEMVRLSGELISKESISNDLHQKRALRDHKQFLIDRYGLLPSAANEVLKTLGNNNGWTLEDALGLDIIGGQSANAAEIRARVKQLNEQFKNSCGKLLK